MAEQGETGITRRDVLKVGATAGVAVGAALIGAGSAAERSLRGLNEDRTFRVGDNDVRVFWKQFNPQEGEIVNPDEAVIYLVGAPMRAKASVSWDEPRELATTFKARAYTIDARPAGYFDSNSIDLEVEGIRRFIEDKGINKVTIFGHSIGAFKAINLAVSLEQSNPGIAINGVVLANPMGFFSQSLRDLVAAQGRESSSGPKLANPKRAPENPMTVNWQFAGSIASDIAETGLQYGRLLNDQINGLTSLNPNLGRVKAPVVVLIAANDNLADAKKILPEDEIQKRLAPPEPEDQVRQKIWESGKWERLSEESKAKFGSKEAFVEDYLLKYRSRETMARISRARKAYLQEVLPQSSALGVIVATKYANHIGFTVERYQSTARVASRIFEKLKRAA